MANYKYGLWLDDMRKPSHKFLISVDTYYVAESFEDAIFYLASFHEDESYEDLFISFDHDLGASEKSGYDLAKWLIEHNIEIGGFTIHSMNPVGAKNIWHLLTHYNYNYVPQLGAGLFY